MIYSLLPVLCVHYGRVGPGQVEGADDVLLPVAAGNVQAGLPFRLHNIYSNMLDISLTYIMLVTAGNVQAGLPFRLYNINI